VNILRIKGAKKGGNGAALGTTRGNCWGIRPDSNEGKEVYLKEKEKSLKIKSPPLFGKKGGTGGKK